MCTCLPHPKVIPGPPETLVQAPARQFKSDLAMSRPGEEAAASRLVLRVARDHRGEHSPCF